MLKVKKTGVVGAAPVTFELGHGALLTARVVDAFAHKLTLATARAELSALIAGDATEHVWTSFTRERVDLIRRSETAQAAAVAWMHTVLLATATATSISGVVDEEGVPLEPSFEVFELLFNDAGVESVFRLQAFKVEALWSAEKNASGPSRNTSGPEDVTTAAPAETPANPARLADAAQTARDAPSSSTQPAPERENLPSNSPPVAAAGTS